MKKLVLLFFVLTTLLVGCDNNKNDNIEIETRHYMDTSETVNVSSYNKYKLVELDKTNNEDGSITVTLKFDKPIK